MPVFITVRELSKRWEVPTARVLYLIRSRRILAVDVRRMGSNRPVYEVSQSEVERFEKECAR